jgi:hypothetical protein
MINELITGINNEVIRKLDNQGLYSHKKDFYKTGRMINNYIEQILINIQNDDIIINGLCEEYKNNKDVY